MELQALREHIQGRDAIADQIAAASQEDQTTAQNMPGKDDPTVFESRVRGEDLRKFMSHDDTFEEDIQKGYPKDKLFQKVLTQVEMHSTFSLQNRLIWAQNRGGEDIVCVPSAKSEDTTLRARIIDQAHQVVGHYGPQRTADYI
jgi:hypothetical protein